MALWRARLDGIIEKFYEKLELRPSICSYGRLHMCPCVTHALAVSSRTILLIS